MFLAIAAHACDLTDLSKVTQKCPCCKVLYSCKLCLSRESIGPRRSKGSIFVSHRCNVWVTVVSFGFRLVPDEARKLLGQRACYSS